MADEKPSLKEHHEKMSAVAKTVIVMISATIILELVDISSTVVLRQSALTATSQIARSIASVGAESRITAKRLDDFVELSKKRWTFLKEGNIGKINVPASAETLDLDEWARTVKRSLPTPTPTATAVPAVHHSHRARRSAKRTWWPP